MDSYHDGIQSKAKAIEVQRAAVYKHGMGKVAETVVWTEQELTFFLAAQYKIMRARLFTQDRSKVLDDLVDAYNYIAMLYNEVTKKIPVEAPVV